MGRSKRLFHCFACDQDYPRKLIRKSGTRTNGSKWFLCIECAATYRAARQMDEEVYQAARSDRVLTDSGKIELGWNGVPSERSLKRRSH